MKNSVIYLDTNCYNWLADEFSVNQIANLSAALEVREQMVCLSPINIIEFLQNSSDQRREKLIIVAQQLCDQRLLVEPERLMADFVAQKSSDTRARDLILPDVFSTSDLAQTWSDIKSDPGETFVFDRQAVEQFEASRSLHAYLHAHFSRGGTLANVCADLDAQSADVVSCLQSTSQDRRQQPVPDERIPSICQHARLLAIQIFCVATTPFPSAIEQYWLRIGLEKTAERVQDLYDRLEFLFDEGPFLGMGALMAWQTTRRYNPGNFFDCYHLMYIPYVAHFVTNDMGFHGFRSAFADARLLERITDFESFLVNLDLSGT